MTIKITEHAERPFMYICPTCLNPAPFKVGERWEDCEEMHITETHYGNSCEFLKFANGEARQRRPANPLQTSGVND
jgi:hypothetical protein